MTIVVRKISEIKPNFFFFFNEKVQIRKENSKEHYP